MLFGTAIVYLTYQLNAHIQLDAHYYLSDPSYMFWRILHHPQGELLSLSQNCLL
jgi:hypothetical protein